MYNALFHTTAWQVLLQQSFGSQTIYGWNTNSKMGLAITVFRAGAFRIGYVGFPVGGTIGEHQLDHSMLTEWKKARLPLTPHCVRIPISAFDHPIDLHLPSKCNPETAITGLRDWKLDEFPKLRRDVKKSGRSGLIVTDATTSTPAEILYRLYRKTVLRHSGNLRYNTNYFSSLIALSQKHKGLRCLLAVLDGQIGGFLVVARHGRIANYLHGATDPRFKQHSPSDLLLYEAITWAQHQEMDCFNLMTSPGGQQMLVRYKEKWGGITKQHKTYTLTIRALPHLCFRVAETFYRVLR